MNRTVLCLLVCGALGAADSIDFEPDGNGLLPDGSTAADNLEITDQFLTSDGISFAVDNNLDGIPDPGATS